MVEPVDFEQTVREAIDSLRPNGRVHVQRRDCDRDEPPGGAPLLGLYQGFSLTRAAAAIRESRRTRSRSYQGPLERYNGGDPSGLRAEIAASSAARDRPPLRDQRRAAAGARPVLDCHPMPIYEFVCMQCESHYEELVSDGRDGECPTALGKRPQQFSVFARTASRAGRVSEAEAEAGGCCGGSCGCGTSQLVAVSHKTQTRPDGAVDSGDARAHRPGRHGRGVTKCRLSVATQVSSAPAPGGDLMFVGRRRAPRGQAGVPFRRPGQGNCWQKLLAEIGLAREDVTSRTSSSAGPPEPRPAADEIEACESHLWETDRPDPAKLVATLGNFATAAYRQRRHHAGHGQEREVVLGGNRVLLYPSTSRRPLYTPKMLDVLTADFARIPGSARPRRAGAA